MPGTLNQASAAAALGGVAADSRSLDQLKRIANQDPAKAVKQVSTQFEALFVQMVLKSMRDATPKSGLLDSSEHETYMSMLDEQLSQKIASGGTGLAQVIERQLRRNLAGAAPPGTGATAPSEPTAAPPGAKADPPFIPAIAHAAPAPAPVPAAALAPIPAAGLPKSAGADVIRAIEAAAQMRGAK